MEPKPASSARRPRSPRGGDLDLSDLEIPSDEIRLARIQADFNVARWAFIALLVTIVAGAIAITIVDVDKASVDPIRELFLAAVTGEIGLIAGLRRS